MIATDSPLIILSTNLARIEHGKSANIDSVARLARALEVSLDDLVLGRGPVSAWLDAMPNKDGGS